MTALASFVFWVSALGVFYTYVGYPLLLGLLAHLRPRRPSAPPAAPTVTLLITAYNEEASLSAKLENSLALNYPPEKLQILVAADGSDDHTVGIARSYAPRGVELSFHPERRGKMAAINRAMQQARGEIILLSDANNFYEPGTLPAILGPFSDPKAGVTCGNKVILKSDGALGESEGAYWKYEAWIKEQETRLGCTTGVLGELMAFRRSLFEYPPEEIINDDFYLAMRIARQGYNILYVPAARSAERVSLTAQDEIERRARIVAGRYQAIALAGQLLPLNRPVLAWQVISHKFMRPLVPFAMILALAANLLLVFLPSPTGWPRVFSTVTLGMQLLFYLLAAIGNLFPPPQGRGKPFYLPAFLLNSNSAALQGLARYLSKRQSSTWEKARRRE